jgi:hypothetical protein
VFGRSTAIIDLDLAGLTEDQSISTLLGSAPGLVGSDRPLPLQELRRAPWQVVLFRGIDRCAIPIRDTISQALERGSFTDAMGRSLPLGATVVVMTAPAVDQPALLPVALGPALLADLDVSSGTPGQVSADGRNAWLQREVLDPLAARFARQGYTVSFDGAFTSWLAANLPTNGESVDAFIDRAVTPALAASLPPERGACTISVDKDRPILRSVAK